jgi:hypothetical protein
MALGAAVLCTAQTARTTEAAAAAERKLAQAEELFAGGDYAAARDFIAASVGEYEAGTVYYPDPVIARFYVLDALVAYAFRDEGYEARVDAALKKGIAISLDLQLGDPATVPTFVQDRFAKLMAEELGRYARTARRSAVGLSGALALGSSELDISLLQAGLSYTYNLSDSFSLDAGIRVPLQAGFWEHVKAQAGLLWYPSFRVERICTGVSFYYMLGFDAPSSFTHSLSFGGRIDFVTRSGFGVGGNAELARADLVASSTLPSTSTITLLDGLVRIVFSNITLYAYYAF